MRTDSEGVLIEKSKNAVRLSLKIKQSDEIEKLLCLDFCRFLMQRAESFMILRRKAISVSPSTRFEIALEGASELL